MLNTAAFSRKGSSSSAAGFTLPELVATLVIIGLLAAVAVPRFVTQTEFDVFGFSEQTRAALRFAQKSAIAKRRLVCVSSAANSLSLRVATNFRAAACDQPLLNPATGKDYVQTAPSAVGITTSNFSFDELGRASAAVTLSVSGGNLTKTINIDAETGYAY